MSGTEFGDLLFAICGGLFIVYCAVIFIKELYDTEKETQKMQADLDEKNKQREARSKL
jgi:hypothetical protein